MSRSSGSDASWSLAQRIGFRFAFVYFFRYVFPFPAGTIPGTEWLATIVNDGLKIAVPRVGAHLLGLELDPGISRQSLIGCRSDLPPDD